MYVLLVDLNGFRFKRLFKGLDGGLVEVNLFGE